MEEEDSEAGCAHQREHLQPHLHEVGELPLQRGKVLHQREAAGALELPPQHVPGAGAPCDDPGDVGDGVLVVVSFMISMRQQVTMMLVLA